MLELNNKWQIIYNRRHRKYKIVRKQAGLDEYVFYSILNTHIDMELGIAASVVRSKTVIKIFYSVKEYQVQV